jgi:thermostable 8-oxoguanine DNA glycosylase
MENILNKKIMAFVPEYVENRGNCTTIYTKENEPIILDRHIKTFIKNICKYYMIDLTATRKRYSKLVISPNMMPIPLSKHDIFIPFKTRVPLAKNDGSLGYVNMRYIKNLSDGDGITTLHLEDNLKIKCLCNISTARKQMKSGYIVKNCFKDRSMYVAENEFKDENIFYYNENKPIVIIYEK